MKRHQERTVTINPQATIEIWTQTAQPEGKAALPTIRKPAALEVSEVRIADLADNLGDLMAQVQTAFEKAGHVASSLTVEEIELNIGINAKGGLALIGKLEAGMEAGIKVKLKRRNG
jgi:hypothetical protein